MISFLKWKIIELDFLSLTILTSSWVWYNVNINEKIYLELALELETGLYIYHHITEWYQSLFGFIDSSERKIFTELIKISWIWWKIAMQILSLSIERLLNAVIMWDNKTIESIKWIWKKMAEKIILELKDKDFWIILQKQDKEKIWKNISQNLYDSIKNTLVNMWYNSKDIDKILSELPSWMENAWDILPYVIKELS